MNLFIEVGPSHCYNKYTSISDWHGQSNELSENKPQALFFRQNLQKSNMDEPFVCLTLFILGQICQGKDLPLCTTLCNISIYMEPLKRTRP